VQVARLSSETLAKLVARTHYALLNDSSQTDPGLKCARVVVKAEAKTMSVTSCDRYRLSQATAPCAPGAADAELLVPGKAVRELKAFLDEDAEVTVLDSPTHLFFQSGARQLSSRKADTTYPAVERIIPRANTEQFEVGRADLLSAVRRVAGVSDSEVRNVQLTVAKAALTVSAQGDSSGDAAEAVGIDYTGDGVQVELQERFLSDFLESLPDTDRVRFSISKDGGNRPLLVEAVGADVLGVIVPIVPKAKAAEPAKAKKAKGA
jgi:DNA polymerase III sliding clamp (beta) subunit (PCNA family)